ncbi:hypothetical protein QZH41_018803 [Actinostola sp. cb2023]|nr:hypothetical protein QZH41_018803 [Actinostola sp. cb2023]
MKIHPVKDPKQIPKELDIALDLEYTGGCRMTIQVDFPFSKVAYFSVKLVSLKGRARLQFCRNPCTHWSLSFYEKDKESTHSNKLPKIIKNKTKFTANFQRPPNKMQDKNDQVDGFDETAVNFKNVAVDSDENDSDEEFVNIMLPLFGEQASSEEAKTAMRDFLTRSTELRQRSRKGHSINTKPTTPTSPIPESKKMLKINTENIRSESHKAMSTTVMDGKPDINSSETHPRALSLSGTRSVHVGAKPTKPSLSSDETIKNSLVIKPSTYCERPGTKRTKEVPPSQDPVWNETVKLDLSPKDVYLNVCVWSKQQEKNDKDIIMGHFPITGIQANIAYPNKALVSYNVFSRPALRGIPGLNENLCGGDMSLSFVHSPSTAHCNDSAVLEKMEELEKLKAEEEESDSEDTFESSRPVEHNFILTQFYFPTRCNYCSKKLALENDDSAAKNNPVEQEKGEAVASDMVAASEQVKEMGRELFTNMAPDERKKKLQDMMAKLQVEIDEENETQTDLYVAKKRTKDKKLKAHFVSLIGKSEERSQALAMLMLQYCAGLQDCADAEDEGCYDL